MYSFFAYKYTISLSLLSRLLISVWDDTIGATGHGAKLVTGLEDGMFPHFNSMDDSEALEEERRLFYVGITRSKMHLYLSLAGFLLVVEPILFLVWAFS